MENGKREMDKCVQGVIFDLDGTLLNTLDDLAASTNAALEMHGMLQRTIEEVRCFVGNGVAKLIARAVPEDTDEATTDAVLADFVAHYALHNRDHTAPYDGIMQMIEELRRQGVRCAVVSNKIEPAAIALCREYFGDLIEAAIGDAPERPRKPDPTGVYEAIKQMDVSKEACVYVGDSDVDIETGHRAGMRSIGVTWGFRGEDVLRAAGADAICHTAQELLAYVLSAEGTNAESI